MPAEDPPEQWPHAAARSEATETDDGQALQRHVGTARSDTENRLHAAILKIPVVEPNSCAHAALLSVSSSGDTSSTAARTCNVARWGFTCPASIRSIVRTFSPDLSASPGRLMSFASRASLNGEISVSLCRINVDGIIPAYVGRSSGELTMPSQIPAFRRTVALRMAGHRERIAARIRNDRERQGIEPIDFARKIGVNLRTLERWELAETTPQLRHAKALSDATGRPVTDFRPDLQNEEDAVLERLGEVQAQLALITEFFNITADPHGHPETTYADAYQAILREPAAPDETATTTKTREATA